MFENIFKKREKENGPDVRVVGNVSEEIKAEARQRIKNLFGEDHFENLPEEAQEEFKKFEYPKTKEELLLIDLANKETNEIMRKCGVVPRGVSEENLHIVPDNLYSRALGKSESNTSTASTVQSLQMVVYKAGSVRGDDFYFGDTTFHEMLHLKSYFAVQVKEEEGLVERKDFRGGLSAHSSFKKDEQGEKHEHLRGLDEAVIVREEKKFAKGALYDLPMFKEEKDWFNSLEADGKKNSLSRKYGIPKESILWVSREDEGGFIHAAYCGQAKTYEYVLSEIQKQFSQRYKDSDEVSLEFLKGFFTGKLLGVAKLVEKTFGKGSFRVLGSMGADDNSAINILEILKSLRRAELSRGIKK